MIACREARPSDAAALCAIINPLILAGGTTAHREVFTPERMVSHFIEPPFFVSCFLAETEGAALGFQALKWPDPDYDGYAPLPEGWAIIATFVDAAAHGQGVGRALFDPTKAVAEAAGVVAIDATIKAENTGGLRFYSGLGFEDYRQSDERLSKRFDIQSSGRASG